MRIHFICRGNVLRSYIAETYLSSLGLNVSVSSSGTVAEQHRDANKKYFTRSQALLRRHGLSAYAKSAPEQLTQSFVTDQDLVICMNATVMAEARELVKLPKNTLCWDITDIGEGNRIPIHGDRAPFEAMIYAEITAQVDKLVKTYGITQSRFDITDSNDQLLGATASYDEVHHQGLWHRGVHIILYTPDRHIVMQKRAASLAYHPGEVEISVGGGVDAGETPEQAVIRETKEELGITLQASDIRFIDKIKSNHRTKTQINRNFIYSYAACIPRERLTFAIDSNETQQVFLLSERKLRRALRTHRIKHIGKITSTYAYWQHLLDAIL